MVRWPGYRPPSPSSGPDVTLPPQAEATPGLADFLRREGYPEAAEQMAGRSSALRLFLTLVNSQACVLLFAYWTWSIGIGRAWETPHPIRLHLSPPAVAAIALFLTASAVPFLSRLWQAIEAGP